MIDTERLRNLHRAWTTSWHTKVELTQELEPWTSIELNHKWNFLLWHEEDIARRDDIQLSRTRIAKRNIDSFNQSRNNSFEAIDDYILINTALEGIISSSLLHSETPGMMIDRLSIMALKEFHMNEQAFRDDATLVHRETCANRVAILQEQQSDLLDSLKSLLNDLNNGKKRFKVYRQFKMYNDPELNPQLYKPTEV
jgi:hypothetical protein